MMLLSRFLVAGDVAQFVLTPMTRMFPTGSAAARASPLYICLRPSVLNTASASVQLMGMEP